eukprot:NODE_6977_length_480_cov_3.994334_g6811_i0.p1 GENE.NODE_6977_length_480_cov_3.994334_g6811_i0~~NODE_6977_length_480_cov_3.994334_g6811_i0.p1  ORF type:complete len:156 (+),score=30.66 NODE_6977_length_480_cov_3.994334_g6811_i0:11-478(+)
MTPALQEENVRLKEEVVALQLLVIQLRKVEKYLRDKRKDTLERERELTIRVQAYEHHTQTLRSQLLSMQSTINVLLAENQQLKGHRTNPVTQQIHPLFNVCEGDLDLTLKDRPTSSPIALTRTSSPPVHVGSNRHKPSDHTPQHSSDSSHPSTLR